MKQISILGSTGSIGESTLQIVSAHPDHFQVAGLSVAKNIDRLEKQIKEFQPQAVAVLDPNKAKELKSKLKGSSVKVLEGIEGIQQIAILTSVDTVVSGIVGAAGLLPTLSALKANKRVALANKEVLVMAGRLVQDLLKENPKAKLLPVDSEHSALFQALGSRPLEEVRKLILTASGGPFLNTPLSDLENVTPEQAIKHPRWSMGKKISVDSATMMNKGLEVIEAKWLFGVSSDQIEIVVHPESIVHSLVEFIDGSLLAQLGVTDMKIPIQQALTYPKLLKGSAGYLNLTEISKLHFLKPDFEKFSVLKLAYEAAKIGGTTPCVLNAANEVAVEAFLNGKIRFLDIVKIIEKTLENHANRPHFSLDEILEIDKHSRRFAWDVANQISLVSSTSH